MQYAKTGYPDYPVDAKFIAARFPLTSRFYWLHLYDLWNRLNIMRVVNFSEARNSLKSVIDQVIDDADYTVIARRDAPDAVMMSLDTFNSLMETVHLLKSSANAAHLAKSIEQYHQGKLSEKALLDA
jgi:antitoxin YefM